MSQPHRARRLALQGLCCLDAQGSRVFDLVDLFIDDSKEMPETAAAARRMLHEVFADRDKCDSLLAPHAHHWELGRLAMVDRNILRLAVYELRSGRAPVKVVIAEALRLAKEFSTTESPRFVNGVLDSVAKELGKAASESAAQTGPDDKPDLNKQD